MENKNSRSEIKFEDAYSKLENLIKKLETENLALDEAVSLFEESLKLIRICSSHLENAEKKVKELIKDSNQNFKLKDFEV